MGETGRGVAEHFGLLGEVDVITSTLGKALGGAAGGFVAASEEVCDVLAQRSRPQLFSNALPPTVACSALEAVRVLRREPDRVAKLPESTRVFRERLRGLGFDPLDGEAAIVPIIVGETAFAIRFSERLLEEGVFVTGFGFPVVPEGRCSGTCPDVGRDRGGPHRSGARGVREGRKGAGADLSYTVAPIDGIEALGYRQETHMRPVRDHLGITAFGTNAWTAEKAGDRLIPEHEEEQEGDPEELYVVVRGRARFEIGEDTVGRALGHARVRLARDAADSFRRGGGYGAARGRCQPGRAYEVSGWEIWAPLDEAYRAGDYDGVRRRPP